MAYFLICGGKGWDREAIHPILTGLMELPFELSSPNLLAHCIHALRQLKWQLAANIPNDVLNDHAVDLTMSTHFSGSTFGRTAVIVRISTLNLDLFQVK